MSANQLILISGGNAYALGFTNLFITAPVMANGLVDTSMSDDNWTEVDYDRIDEVEADACRAIEAKLRTFQGELDKDRFQRNTNIMVNREEA